MQEAVIPRLDPPLAVEGRCQIGYLELGLFGEAGDDPGVHGLDCLRAVGHLYFHGVICPRGESEDLGDTVSDPHGFFEDRLVLVYRLVVEDELELLPEIAAGGHVHERVVVRVVDTDPVGVVGGTRG